MLKQWLHAIERALWGDPARKEIPIWECGLLTNSRSQGGGNRESCDGSFSLGITVEERDVGYLVAAKQTGNDRVRWRINQILSFADRFGNFMVERALMPHELHEWRTACEINNATTFGTARLWSNIQLNHSTGVRNLGEAIGKVQGDIHTDPKDWPCSWTMFICWLRFPKGMTSSFDDGIVNKY
jgi:hypothetical protein